MTQSSTVHFVETTDMHPTDEKVHQWIDCAMQKHAYAIEVTCVSAREMALLNGRFRHRFYATNILSFAQENHDLIQGSLVLCPAVLQQEATEDLMTHWAHLIVHGVLHLRGFEHDNPAKQVQMESLEIQLLQLLGYRNPYESMV